MGQVFHLFRVFVLLMAAAIAAPALHAEAAHDKSALPMQTCIAPLHGPNDLARLKAHPETLDCSGDQRKYGSGDFLVQLRFAPMVSEVSNPQVLRLTSVWQDSAKVTFRYADGVETTHSFSSEDPAHHLTLGAIFEMPVPARDAALETAFVEIKGSANVRGVVIGANFLPTFRDQALKHRLIAMYALFGGLAVALLIYNLALWSAMRHRFQLMYSGMVAFLGAYALTSSGVLVILLPQIANNDRIRLNYVLLTMAGVFALLFMRDFFEKGVISRRVHRLISAVSAVAVATAVAYAALSPWQVWWLDHAYFLAMFATVCMVFPIIWGAWRQRSRYLPVFLLAWSAPIIVSVMRSLYGLGLVPYSFWLDNGNLIAFSIEALLSSLLIIMRLRELHNERDLAVAGEQVARRLAATDPLTGLLNRRAFLENAIGRKARHRLLLIDIDHFKTVNDRLGHETGDKVLQALAEAIQQCRPARSLAVRLGGEEFALLLPRSSFNECPAELLLETVRQWAMPQGAQVTVSIGYADGSITTEEDWKRLYRLADSALYRAKSDGRDRACRATDFRVAA